jgi:hypothetical protein
MLFGLRHRVDRRIQKQLGQTRFPDREPTTPSTAMTSRNGTSARSAAT